MRGVPGRISKHRQFDIDPPYKHMPGEVRILAGSSLRKMMRAARRGKMPEDRMFTIQEAQKSAAKHPRKYMSAHKRSMQALLIALEGPRA